MGVKKIKEFEKKIAAFCSRNDIRYELEKLKFNGVRAVIRTYSSAEQTTIIKKVRRMRNVRVSERVVVSYYGSWNGYIYVQDALDAARIDVESEREIERIENWQRIYRGAIASGMSIKDSVSRAESLYHTLPNC